MMGDRGSRPGYSSEYGRGYDRLTEDQRNQLDQLSRRFYDETAKLRSQLWNKSGELSALLDSSNPDVDKARALQKEISELRAKLDQVRINFELEANKINPDLRYARRGGGYGHHMGGYGHQGGGYGHHMGGYGHQGGGYGHRMGGWGTETCW
jgi:zinc resistance-associated protein